MVWRNWSCTNKTIWTQRKSQEKYKEKLQLWDLWRYLLGLRYEVREKKESGKPTRQTDWPMAANQSIVFEDSRGAKEKVLLENLDKRRNCQKDEGQLNHFLPLTSEFMTPPIQGFHLVFGDAAGLMQKSWWKSFLVSIFKKSCRVQSTQRKKRLSKANRKGLKSKKNFC